MRLTADVIERSAAFTNALGERELDLRSNHIALIENLITSKDLFDVIDFTDNEIKRLDNFPRLLRLSTLLLNNNSISKIDSTFFSPRQLPLLHTLMLTNNRLLDFNDLEPLSVFGKQLQNLSLIDNPVTKKPHYRMWVLSRLPHLTTLDFKRVRPAEVAEAKLLFKVGSPEAKTFIPGEEDADVQEPSMKQSRVEALSPEQIIKIKDAIKAASTLAEVNRLERILQTGHIPDAKDLSFLKEN